jgi:hypothetical protein
MATAGDQITAALRLIGVLAEAETPGSEMMLDAVAAMNQMLDSWSTERLSIFTTQTQQFTWPQGVASRTIGPTGNFVGVRPIALDDSTFFEDASTGVSYPIVIVNQSQYNSIAVKDVTSTYPQILWFQATDTDATMTIYPVPTKALLWSFVGVQELTQVTDHTEELVFPPGYLRAFKYNLALEIAPEYGAEPTKDVRRIATVSKRNLKRINNPMDLMSMPYPLVAKQGRYNIYAGTP